MAYPKLVSLVVKLYQQTRAGKIQWESTADDGVFQTSFPNFSVTISVRESRADEYSESLDVVVAILNRDGKLIEEVSDVDFDDSEIPKAYKLMHEMYQTARRQAAGVDKALDQLIGELDKE